MHVGRYKRLLSHSTGLEAFPRTCSSFCPRKNGFDFFQSRISHRRHNCIGTPSLSRTNTHTHTHTAEPRRAVRSASDSRGRGPGFDTQSGHILSFLLPLIQEGQSSVTGESMSKSRTSLVRLTNRPDMTIDVNRGRKTTTHTNTLFSWGEIYYTCLCIAIFPSVVNLSVVHGYRTNQAKPATGAM